MFSDDGSVSVVTLLFQERLKYCQPRVDAFRHVTALDFIQIFTTDGAKSFTICRAQRFDRHIQQTYILSPVDSGRM